MGAAAPIPDLMVFWAKTSQDPAREGHWHPLLCHMLDVGAVATAIWQTTLSPWARGRLASNLSLTEDEVGRWVAFWAAAHDIGKCSVVFQLQGGKPELERANVRLAAAGFKSPGGKLSGPHGTISARVLHTTFKDRFKYSPQIAARLSIAIGGHHGVFPAGVQIAKLTGEAVGGQLWDAARAHLLDTLASILDIPRDAPPKAMSNADALWFAGFISVADWVGSNQDYFAPTASDPDTSPKIDAKLYFADTAQVATDSALSRLGWRASPKVPSTTTFDEAFGFSPNTMQTEVFDAFSQTSGPTLAIIEAPMGLGKTEAALEVANGWSDSLGATGLYFALPTRATSNQMLHRIRLYLQKQYPDSAINLQLLQGAAGLSAEFQELQRNAYQTFRPQAVDQDKADQDGWSGVPGVLAASWFTHRKRGLLAPFGVGTVDQALLGALQTRHVFVRLFGLAGKTVVVDEVHAYDIYMSTLLERLLSWLAALGTSVILLSATLPDKRRRALLAAYGGDTETEEVDGSLPTYPRLSFVDAGGTSHVRTLPTPPEGQRELVLEWVPDLLSNTVDEASTLGEQLRAMLRTGGCAAVICNTVRRAQEVYVALQPYFPGLADDGLPQLDLFHARYPFEERDMREKRALLRFGKATTTVEWDDGTARTVQRPHCAVLVATQVIEQSLDLDFDLMVTDPAPVDLLLQRSGRLQRHQRERPSGIGGPTLRVGTPALDQDDVPTFDDGTSAVYDAHILLRSWLALQEKARVDVPGDVSPLIEAVYDDRPPPEDMPDALCRAFISTKEQKMKAHNHDAFKAMIQYIQAPSFEGQLADITRGLLDEDDPTVHPAIQALTRLSAPSINIVCLFGSEDDVYLDVDRAHPVHIYGPIDGRVAAALLRRSVSVSHRGVVPALLGINPPPSWKRQALVRYHLPLLFDAAGTAPIPGTKYTLHLDPELGLITRTSNQ